MLESLATSASITIKNAYRFQEVHGLNRKHESMVQILRALQDKSSVKQMVGATTIAVCEAIEAEKVTLYFDDATGSGKLEPMDVGDDVGYHFDLGPEPAAKNGAIRGTGGGVQDEQARMAVRALFESIAKYCAETEMVINTPDIFRNGDP